MSPEPRERPGTESRRFGGYLGNCAELANLILDSVSGLDEVLFVAQDELGNWISLVTSAHSYSNGSTLAYAQAANEFLDLLFDLAHGRGRPAIKASRSLFELSVTVKDILVDPEACGRYEDHRWVTFAQAIELESMQPLRHKGDAHRRKKAARWVKPHVERVMAEYGPAFRRNWRTSNLADAAERHGLGEEYEFYRIASGVLHGAAGGVLGQYVLAGADDEARPVYRTGVALALCPEAFRRGVRYFAEIVSDSVEQVGEGGVQDLLEACERVLSLQADYEEFIDELDANLWTSTVRHEVITAAVIDSVGRCSWYIHDTRRKELREALPPTDLSDAQRDSLRELIRQIKGGTVEIPANRYGQYSVMMIAVQAKPKPGSKWVHAGYLLDQQPLAVINKLPEA